MRRRTTHDSKIRLWRLEGSLIALAVSLFLMPGFEPVLRHEGNNYFHVFLNGTEVGTCADEEEALECLRTARRSLPSEGGELVFAEAELELTGEEVYWGRVTGRREMTDAMEDVLRTAAQETLERCYTVKIADFIVSLRSKEEVLAFLQGTLAKYDPDGQFVVNLAPDPTREINVLTASVVSVGEQEARQEIALREEYLPSAGIQAVWNQFSQALLPKVQTDFEDYELGLQSLDFVEKIEVVESYLPASQIITAQEAVEEVLREKETSQIHEVAAGDTLSGIAFRYDLSLDDLIAMNPLLTDENSLIRPGDNITVTVPEPELTIRSCIQEYYEEDYEADTIYKDNNSWYTTQSVVLQEPVTGHRRVVADITYENSLPVFTDIVKEETVVAAVPMIVERGTVAPPTYIYPVSGGFISSGFGGRRAPKAGASTNHQGVDIAVPTGTAVMASCGGTVTVAGWQRGYGNVVYISHADGRETRYGHLSKCLVSPGQTVTQGQRIALSGNTGNSTGPHLHFEIRIGGTAVNPLNYISY